MGILSQIIASKRAELAALKTKALPEPPAHVPRVHLRRTAQQPLHLICEIKQKSPSAGELSRVLSVADRARCYQACGASMISVLCDEPFFAGRYEHLLEARSSTTIPLLCKEFVIDEVQLDVARAFGASAVLLIVRCLEQTELVRLIERAKARELTPLVEVFTQDEANRALDAGATFIGVNARDLDTLVMDSERASHIVQSFGPDITVAHLSGIKSPEAGREVGRGRADAALIGEVLMRQDDPAALLTSIKQACS